MLLKTRDKKLGVNNCLCTTSQLVAEEWKIISGIRWHLTTQKLRISQPLKSSNGNRPT